MTVNTLVRAVPLAAAVLVVNTAAGAAQRAESFSLQGGRVAVYNLAGQVRVEPGSGSAVQVEVVRGGSDAGRLRVQRGQSDGAETLSVLYPGERVVYPALGRGSRSELTVRQDGTFGGGSGRGGRRVTVAGSGSGLQAHADLVVRVPAGRAVSIHQGVGRVNVANVNGDLRVRTASASVAASRTRGLLDVDVGSGRVEVRDADGDLRVDTGSGSVVVERVRGRRLEIDTGSGGVRGRELRADELVVDVGSGGVDLVGVTARDVVVDTGSGSVVLELAGEARSVRIDTGSGGVRLGIPDGLGAELEIDTGSGGIDVDIPVVARRSSRSRLIGRIGDGRGRIEIDTGSGGVRIYRL